MRDADYLYLGPLAESGWRLRLHGGMLICLALIVNAGARRHHLHGHGQCSALLSAAFGSCSDEWAGSHGYRSALRQSHAGATWPPRPAGAGRQRRGPMQPVSPTIAADGPGAPWPRSGRCYHGDRDDAIPRPRVPPFARVALTGVVACGPRRRDMGDVAARPRSGRCGPVRSPRQPTRHTIAANAMGRHAPTVLSRRSAR